MAAQYYNLGWNFESFDQMWKQIFSFNQFEIFKGDYNDSKLMFKFTSVFACSCCTSFQTNWADICCWRGKLVKSRDFFFILFLSNFSEDIIDEMFGLSFSKFNNESGSYQVIIPNAAHFFLFDQQVWLLF